MLSPYRRTAWSRQLKAIQIGGVDIAEAITEQITILLKDEIDTSRGET